MRVWETRCKKPNKHSVLDMTQYQGKDAHGDPVMRRYCLACRKDLPSENFRRHHGGPTCWRGHLKTARTWRLYKSGFRCLPCEYERRKVRRSIPPD